MFVVVAVCQWWLVVVTFLLSGYTFPDFLKACVKCAEISLNKNPVPSENMLK